MTIYTRKGDTGTTSLADGSRVAKDDPRVEAYGTIDEANSAIGLARSANTDPTLEATLCFVQQRLFNCSSSVATPRASHGPKTPRVEPGDIRFLEDAIDSFDARTGTLDHFIMEAGGETACRLMLARAVMRRAERALVSEANAGEVDANVLAFVNRSSDLLFAAARYANAVQGVPEERWDPESPVPTL
jgi:cob(I)alamin adenosyltransferase